MELKLTFPSICTTCGQPLTGRTVCTVIAGSAWQDGVAAVVDGAEMFRTRAYHEDCAPPAPESEGVDAT